MNVMVKATRLLSSILDEKVAKESLLMKIQWFALLLRWMQRSIKSEEGIVKIETVYTTRIKYLMQLLNGTSAWKEHFSEVVSEIVLEMSRSMQLSSAGLSANKSFQQEFIHRFQEKILPAQPVTSSLDGFIIEIFPNESESILVDAIDENILSELFQFLCEDSRFILSVKKNILLASHILSLECLTQAYNLLKELNVCPDSVVHLSEYKMEERLRRLCEKAIQNQSSLASESGMDISSLKADFFKSVEHIEYLENKMKFVGVKIDLVYNIKNQKRKLDRLRILLDLLDPSVKKALSFRLLLSKLIVDCHHQRSFVSFLSENLTLIIQRVVQSNSIHGEHYVTYNWADFRKMFYSASGAGVITAFTVFMKSLISHTKLEGLVKGLVDSANYSISFLIIQLLGFTLATKQPSSTAPFIADVLKTSVTASRKAVVALLRTQFIAVLGNLSLVFPVCFFVSWLSIKLDHPILDTSQALQAFHYNEIIGPTPIFAIFTGFLLFAGGIMAGWFENFCAVNRLEERLQKNSRLVSWFGQKKAEKLAQFIMQNSNALAGNFSLGILLGVAPKVAQFFSLPLDVRHVTLSTGQFAATLPGVLDQNLAGMDYLNVGLGLLSIGLLNIGVSFLLTLIIASISSEVSIRSFLKFIWWGARLVMIRPWLLIVPEKNNSHKNQSSTPPMEGPK